MSLFDSVVDKLVGSSNIILTLARHIANVAAEVKKMKETLADVVHTVNTQQIILDELLHEKIETLTNDHSSSILDTKKNLKKEKPN